jgi:hypothetical protein
MAADKKLKKRESNQVSELVSKLISHLSPIKNSRSQLSKIRRRTNEQQND